MHHVCRGLLSGALPLLLSITGLSACRTSSEEQSRPAGIEDQVSLPAEAERMRITIRDQEGNVVYMVRDGHVASVSRGYLNDGTMTALVHLTPSAAERLRVATQDAPEQSLRMEATWRGRPVSFQPFITSPMSGPLPLAHAGDDGGVGLTEEVLTTFGSGADAR